MSLSLAGLPVASAMTTQDLVELSLQELGNVKITSVSKKPERLADAPASIYVISREDIRRSGALTLPEALRLAPNLHVAQTSSAGYAISARGMNGSNNSAPNKMLVMIDGRSIYSPLFSGVFWDAQDLMLEDIERIEVISGPGGTLWGVNAVNAVVNIITRSATDTKGSLLSVSGGQPDSQAALRYGGAIGDSGSFRAYAKLLNRNSTDTAAGTPLNDSGHRSLVGFRLDFGGSDNHFDLSGNAYHGLEGQPAPGAISVGGSGLALGDVEFSGSNLTARWDGSLASGGNLQLKAYFDRTERVVPPTFSEKLDILDLEFLHSLAPVGRHGVSWGFNYRRSRDRVINSQFFAFLPGNLNQAWASAFLQDKVALADSVDLTLGARVERNDYTGNEVLPSARIAWRLSPDHMLWAAASRAVRAPSRLDRDARIPGLPPFLLDGGPAADSELADVVEMGYRGQPTRRLSFSATVFHTAYDHLRTLTVAPAGTYYIFGSDMAGHATGAEFWGKFQATPTWRISAGLITLHEKLHLKPGGVDVTAPAQVGNDPSNTWQIRSSWDMGRSLEFDLAFRHVSDLERNLISAHTSLDARLGWRPREGLELAVSGRNLTGSHAEYGTLANRAELDRGVVVSLAWVP
jgi:iron complex outermembrane receptor protein